MKKKQELKKKLALDKKTILKLTKDEMNKVVGREGSDKFKDGRWSFADDCLGTLVH